MNWTEIDPIPVKKGKDWFKLYKCSCGTIRWVRKIAVDTGKSKSCGCLKNRT